MHRPAFPSSGLTKGLPFFLALTMACSLAGCGTLGGSGPSTRAVSGAADSQFAAAPIKVVELTDDVARAVLASERSSSLSEAIGDGVPYGSVVAKGDVLDIAIWEAPPAVLFGVAGSAGQSIVGQDQQFGVSRSGSQLEQMVDSEGLITVPFVGAVRAAGRTPKQIESEIERRLAGLAHGPQSIVRQTRNAGANVTVVGEVVSSTRMALTPKGERLLDAIAAAGGLKQQVDKVTIQVARSGSVASMPMERIIRDPSQNIRLQPDDVVTAYYQPFNFTALGAVGNNAEIPFESTGISLAQALGRVGGLKSDRADVRGVFIFRLENPRALDPALVQSAQTTPDGRIPVIYRVDMKNPASFFVAQSFPIRDDDVLYVSTAPLADLQRFVGIVSSFAFTALGLKNAL